MKRIAFLAVAAVLAMPLLCGAAVKHWNGEGDGSSWSDPNNWLEDAVPATTADGETADDVEISGAHTVYITASVQSIKSLTLTGDASNQPVLYVGSGLTLKLQSLNVIHGGLVLQQSDGVGASVAWAKMNRGSLQVQSDGYIAGSGTITTTASSTGVRLMSTRSDAFDMTDITLKIGYQEPLRVCSPDTGRATAAAWSAANFCIKRIEFTDYRYNHTLQEADGSGVGDTNALYCHELKFYGSASGAARLDLNGINVYVRDRLIWYDNSSPPVPGQQFVPGAYSAGTPDYSLWDDSLQAQAWVSYPQRTISWDGGGTTTDWTDGKNWEFDFRPGTTSDGETADSAVINGDYAVDIDASVQSIKSLTINGSTAGEPTVHLNAGVQLKLQTLNVIYGGFILDGSGANVLWSKANRGSLQVQANGYIAGSGVISTLTSTGAGVYLMSTRSQDFDMTGITLKLRYMEKLRVCSADIGRDTFSGWHADNFAIGTLVLGDYRHDHKLFEADGSTVGDSNALYCHQLQFEGSGGTGSRLDIQGINVYVRDKVTWFNGSYTTTPGQLTVADAFSTGDVTTSLYCDSTPKGTAWLGSSAICDPLPLVVKRTGISLGCSGVNGKDWVVEWRYHDPNFDDHAILYVRSGVNLSLQHNDLNVVSAYAPYISYDRVIGRGGVDGDTGTPGDEGEIHWDFDGDSIVRDYIGTAAAATTYTGPFNIGTCYYPGTSTAVWGSYSATGGTDGYGRKGLRDSLGEEYHTLNIWDDDSDFVSSSPNGKVQASDGYVWVVVTNVQAPVIQFVPVGDGQFYTTPAKTYHIPLLKPVTSYLSGEVEIQLFNLSDSTDPIYYQVDGGNWVEFTEPVVASQIFSTADTVYTFSCKIGANGAVRTRTIHWEPDQPADGETHPGNLLFDGPSGKSALIARLSDNGDNQAAFERLLDQASDDVGLYPWPRREWRGERDVANQALKSAFAAYFHPDGVYVGNYQLYALRAKELLLGFGVVDPLGHERPLWQTTPSPDRLSLGQEQHEYLNAAVAYDLLAMYQKDTLYVGGMTAVEHLKIRDNLGNIAMTALQFRDKCGNSIGEGDTHWAHGLDEIIMTCAMAMPDYDSPAWGMAGAPAGTQLQAWRPFLNTKLTWFEATDPDNNSLATGTWPQDNKFQTLRLFTLYQSVTRRDVNYNVTYDQTVWLGAHSGKRFSTGAYATYSFADSDTYHLDDGGYETPFRWSQAALLNMRNNFYGCVPANIEDYFGRHIVDRDKLFLSLTNSSWLWYNDAFTLAQNWQSSVTYDTFLNTMADVYALSFCSAFD